MKTSILLVGLVLIAGAARSATTIDPVNKFAYGANIGWLDAAGDTANGAVIGEFVCSGYIYSANVGWINLGSGTAANGIQYQNNSAADFGVNRDSAGNLRGYAYSANVGWIAFEETGAPKVDLVTGKLIGNVWSANCGWISLSNSEAYVQTDTIEPGALAPNGLPIAWLLTYFGTIEVDPNADPDGDGMTNLQEYHAGTNPTNPDSKLLIMGTPVVTGTTVTLTWSSTPARVYHIEKTDNLMSGLWTDSGLGVVAPDPGTNTTRSFTDTSGQFYRIRVVIPPGP
jgi:hypothetical protein